MSGLEIAIPVIGAVFALVSAFKDGGTIVEKILERRRRKNAQPPNERLQKVLDQGAQQIEQLREEGFEEFGAAFARDAATASKLKDITIALQDSIIKQLAAAHNDDNMNDFTPAIDAVNKARREAINTLNQLAMALQDRREPAGQTLQPQQITAQAQPSPSRAAAAAATPDERPTFTGSPPPSHADVSPTARLSWSSLSRITGLRRTSTDAVQRPLLPPPRRSPHFGSNETISPLTPNTLVLSPQSFRSSTGSSVTTSPQLNRISGTPHLLSPPQTPRETVAITEANRYAGFCKGAWHAQNLRLSKAMQPSMREYEWLYHCRKCNFRLRADDSRRGDPHFDDRMCVSGTVYFRPLFLVKSHIGSRDSVRRYQCLLCALSGERCNAYDSESHLFEHIARHEGSFFGDTRISGPVDISHDGVSACSMLDFDIYFPRSRRSSGMAFMLPESVMGVDQDHPHTTIPEEGNVLSPVMAELEA